MTEPYSSNLTAEQARNMEQNRLRRDREACVAAFQKFHDETLPHMDFGSRHAERQFVWEACWRYLRHEEVVKRDIYA